MGMYRLSHCKSQDNTRNWSKCFSTWYGTKIHVYTSALSSILRDADCCLAPSAADQENSFYPGRMLQRSAWHILLAVHK